MKDFNYEVLEFDGKLNSLRYLCNKYGIDSFTLLNGFKLNRVQELYNSDLSGNNYIENILLSENYEEDFYNLVYKDKVINIEYNKLIDIFNEAEKNYCGVGIGKTKKILDKLSKKDIIAKVIKIALEVEEANINAKQTMSNFKYQLKEDLILKLIEICEENNINYGFGYSDIKGIPNIIYFDLPCGQLSWHTILDKKNFKYYTGKWDGIEFATLNKIEKFIKNKFFKEYKNLWMV